MRAALVLALILMAVPAQAACPNAENMLPSLKAQGLKAEIIVGARLDVYAHLALKHLGLDMRQSPRAVLERKDGQDHITFEDAGGCLLPISVKVPKTEFV